MTDLTHDQKAQFESAAIAKPLVTHMYTADPSAHVFDGRIFVYPSHDIDAGIPFNDNGDHFGMEDYHVFSMSDVNGEVIDHGLALHVDDVPWAERQMWAPDAAQKDGKYYFYFPAKKADGIFQIGVAVGNNPAGPFTAQPLPIEGSYSIDPAVFEDDDGSYYLYFGGLWGGQLEHYPENTYANTPVDLKEHDQALGPRVAKLSEDMLTFEHSPKQITILDENGAPLTAGDIQRRYFEGPWLHKFNDLYYLSYSTGDSHLICYATSESPYGPFNYKGVLLEPVVGWTTHHSVVEYQGQWYLFYHDSVMSGGVTHLRSMKATPIEHQPDGSITTVTPYPDITT